jgi:hypothetical protein
VATLRDVALPSQGDTSWYDHYQALDNDLRREADYKCYPETYGAVGNGSTNDYTAFANAATAAAGGGWVMLRPGRTYALADEWSLPSNTRIWAYGATIKTTSSGTSDRVVVCENVSNIRIYGLTIDGDKDNFAPVTEQRHGFHLIGASDVHLIDVKAFDCKGDGLYTGRGASAGCSDLVVERGIFDGNHRNAYSAVDISGGRFTDCQFINTDGTTPEDGIDIEPNVTDNAVTDLVFTRCELSGNSGDGVGLNRLSTGITPNVSGIKFVNCPIKNNGLRGVIHSYGNRLAFIDCDVEDNDGYAYSLEPTANATDIDIVHGNIRNNLRTAVRASPAASMNLIRLRIEGVNILDNSTEGNGFYEAIDIGARVTYVMIALNMIHNTGSTGMDSPIKTVATVTHVSIIGNRYKTISANSLGDDAGTRQDFGNG